MKQRSCRHTVLAQLRRVFPTWADRLGADHVLDLSLLGQLSDTALTQPKAIELEANGLPNTFVPGRNLVFFTFAAALAFRRGLAGPCMGTRPRYVFLTMLATQRRVSSSTHNQALSALLFLCPSMGSG